MNPREHCKAVTLRSGRTLVQLEEEPTEETSEKSESQAEKKEKEAKKDQEEEAGRKKSYQTHTSLPNLFLRDFRKPN